MMDRGEALLYHLQCQLDDLFHRKVGLVGEDAHDDFGRWGRRETQHGQCADGLVLDGGVDSRRAGLAADVEFVGDTALHDLVLQVDDDALCRAQSDALDRLQHLFVTVGNDVAQFCRCQRREDRACGVGSDTRDGDQQTIE